MNSKKEAVFQVFNPQADVAGQFFREQRRLLQKGLKFSVDQRVLSDHLLHMNSYDQTKIKLESSFLFSLCNYQGVSLGYFDVTLPPYRIFKQLRCYARGAEFKIISNDQFTVKLIVDGEEGVCVSQSAKSNVLSGDLDSLNLEFKFKEDLVIDRLRSNVILEIKIEENLTDKYKQLEQIIGVKKPRYVEKAMWGYFWAVARKELKKNEAVVERMLAGKFDFDHSLGEILNSQDNFIPKVGYQKDYIFLAEDLGLTQENTGSVIFNSFTKNLEVLNASK